jgi:hypothetical protein
MPFARLIHRGEEFEFSDGANRYEGTCLWSWQVSSDAAPRRVGPIHIYAESIRRTGVARLVPLSLDKKIAIAHQCKALLEARDPGLEFVVIERSGDGGTSAPGR